MNLNQCCSSNLMSGGAMSFNFNQPLFLKYLKLQTTNPARDMIVPVPQMKRLRFVLFCGKFGVALNHTA